MSDDIGKGDLVECITRHGADSTVVGRIYTVSDTFWHASGLCTCHHKNLGGLRLEEVQTPVPLGWYCVGSFRRLGPKRGAFDHLLSVEPAKEPEEARA